MKPQSSLRTLIMSLTAIIFVSSCAKEVQRPSASHYNASSNQQQPTSYSQPQQKILNLVASTWQKNADGAYVNLFKGAMQYGGGALPVRIYLVDQNSEALISSGALKYSIGRVQMEIYPLRALTSK
jgi:hypothetical protein